MGHIPAVPSRRRVTQKAAAAIDLFEKAAALGVTSRNTALETETKDSWGGHSLFFVRYF